MQWGTSARGWVRNRQCTNAGFVIGNVPDFLQCAARTPNTQTHNINIPTIHPYAQASMHTYTHTHVCNTHMHTCIPSHDACRVRLLVLPIDDTDSANSACPKPRRAKSCRQPRSNQKHLDGKMYKTLTPLNPDPMRRCTTSLCSLQMPYCCCFFKAFANTQTTSS